MIKFLVGDRSRGVWSYPWRISASGTSFYLVGMSPGMQIKISLHGPDPRFALGGFKITLVDQEDDLGVTNVTDGWLPHWFPGLEIKPGTWHAVRFRVPWHVFNHIGPLPPERLRASEAGLLIGQPPTLQAADIDIYVSNDRPYWPNESEARRNNAAMGPLVNNAGQYLTGLSRRSKMLDNPTPAQLNPGPMPPLEDRVRGLAGAEDPSGFLWITEEWMSRARLQRQGYHPDGAVLDEHQTPAAELPWRPDSFTVQRPQRSAHSAA